MSAALRLPPLLCCARNPRGADRRTDASPLTAPPHGGRGMLAVPVPGASAYRVSQKSVARLDVLVPRSRSAGARVGGLSGAVVGALVGAGLEVLLNELFAAEESWAFSIGVGARVGAALGTLGGALRPGARWQRVPLGARNTASTAQQHRRLTEPCCSRGAAVRSCWPPRAASSGHRLHPVRPRGRAQALGGRRPRLERQARPRSQRSRECICGC